MRVGEGGDGELTAGVFEEDGEEMVVGHGVVGEDSQGDDERDYAFGEDLRTRARFVGCAAPFAVIAAFECAICICS